MNRRRVLLDMGPLVAVVNQQDQFHSWVTAQWATIELPCIATYGCCLTPPFSRYHETAVEHKRAGGKI